MLVRIQKLDPRARIPSRGSAQAAGYDLYACLPAPELTIAPHTNCRVGTGLAIAVPEGYLGPFLPAAGWLPSRGCARPTVSAWPTATIAVNIWWRCTTTATSRAPSTTATALPSWWFCLI